MVASPKASAKPAASENVSGPNTTEEMPTCQPSKGPTEVRMAAVFSLTDLLGPRSGGGAGAATANLAKRLVTAMVATAKIRRLLFIRFNPLHYISALHAPC